MFSGYFGKGNLKSLKTLKGKETKKTVSKVVWL